MSTLQATDSSTKATDKQYNSILLLCSHLAKWPCVWSVVRGRGCAVRCVRALVGRAQLCWAWGGVRSRVIADVYKLSWIVRAVPLARRPAR